MLTKRRSGNRGFTLVELLLVIVLIAILMALVTLSGASMVESTNAQTEARRMIRTVHSLRSAWLAAYADSQMTIGIPSSTWPVWIQASIDQEMSRYSDRSLIDEINRYGTIRVVVNPSGKVGTYIGFASGANHGIWDSSKKSSGELNTMREMLKTQQDSYGMAVYMNATSNDFYIRIK
jgi:prepilin-type N-terminal cleavage/methylation domain-containing protein